MTQPNEAAFAKSAFYHPDGGVDSPQEGLTKREYFAVTIIQGMLSNTENLSVNYKDIAKGAVTIADALIEALNK